MKNSTFIGRKTELEKLNQLLKKNTASLVVIKGRRRIGKSRLVKEFVSVRVNAARKIFTKEQNYCRQ